MSGGDGVYVVTLEKATALFGNAQAGERYEAVFRTARPQKEAVARAYQMLKRDRTSENPLEWKLVGTR